MEGEEIGKLWGLPRWVEPVTLPDQWSPTLRTSQSSRRFAHRRAIASSAVKAVESDMTPPRRSSDAPTQYYEHSLTKNTNDNTNSNTSNDTNNQPWALINLEHY